jgi:hypothetical protein
MNGKIVYVPKSINFASMDQTEFEKFYSRCIDTAIKYFAIGETPEQVALMAEEYLHFA